MTLFENKIMAAIDAALTVGYDNTQVGTLSAGGLGVSSCQFFGTKDELILKGEALYVYVGDEDLSYFQSATNPDLELVTESGDNVLIYQA